MARLLNLRGSHGEVDHPPARRPEKAPAASTEQHTFMLALPRAGGSCLHGHSGMQAGGLGRAAAPAKAGV